MRAPPHDLLQPNYLPKVSSLNIITLGVRVSTCNCGEQDTFQSTASASTQRYQFYLSAGKKSIFQQKYMDGSMCLLMKASVFPHGYPEATDELEIHVRTSPKVKGR